MKYVKAEAPFALEDGKRTLIQAFYQKPGETMRNNEYIKAAMQSEMNSDKMVLLADVKSLLPYPTRGAILKRSYSINMAGVQEIQLHPEVFDELVEKGVLDKKGTYLKETSKKAPAVVVEEVIAEPAIKEPTIEEPIVEEPDIDIPKESPLDVNQDGAVDAKDVKIVADAAAESLDQTDGEDAGENSTATDPAEN